MLPWRFFGGLQRRSRLSFYRPLVEGLETRALLSFVTAVNYAAGIYPNSVVVGDVNADGFLDLAVANLGDTAQGMPGTVSVLLGTGDGTFQAAKNYPVGFRSTSVAMADFNSDGAVDLAIANNAESTVGVLLNNGDGTFRPAVSYGATGVNPGAVAVGDFNADGHPDVVAAGSSGVTIFLNTGDGTLQAARSYAAGDLADSVAVGDFNSDGRLDVAVADYGLIDSKSTVSILLGKGDGTLQDARSYAVGDGPLSVAVGDFDGDGHPDLVTNSGSTDVSVLRGNGDGTFQPPQSYAAPQPVSVAVGDFNRDGLADLVVAGNDLNLNGRVSVLLGKGDGSFQAAVSYAAGESCTSVAVGDFNSDGFADLAVTNGTATGSVTILLNAADWWPAVSLQMTAPAGIPAGASFDVTVTAVDPYRHVVSNYTGTVAFTSTDAYPGVLPSEYTFTAADHGAHTFSGAMLFTAGMQTLNAQDKANASLTGTATIPVLAAPANHFLLTAPPTALAGTPFDVTLTALDPYGNVDTHYQGTVTFASSDATAGVVLPADYTFTNSDSGAHTFSGGVTLLRAKAQTVIATDISNGSLAAAAATLVTPAPANRLRLSVPINWISGIPFDVEVIALDPYGNIDTSYQGTVTFSTSDPDPRVVLPVDYTLTVGDGGDNGVHTFVSGVTLFSVGNQTVTVTDKTSGITGSATITVDPGRAAPPGGTIGNPRTPRTVEKTLTHDVQPAEQVAVLDRLFRTLSEGEPTFLLARFGHMRLADESFGGEEGSFRDTFPV